MFAYVVNFAKNGDHYWVFAHVTPTFGATGEIIGYHSNRRTPDRAALDKIIPLYRTLLDEERRHAAKSDQIRYGTRALMETLATRGVAYDELMFTL